MQARPTMPPTTPPAIAAVFDLGPDSAILSADEPVVFAACTRSETEAGVAEPCIVDVSRADSPDVFGVSVDVGVGDNAQGRIGCTVEEAATGDRLVTNF